MVFLALLAIAIGVLLVLSLVLVGLVEAPWPILLVGLLAALYGLQRELTESQALVLPDIEEVNQSPAPDKDKITEAGLPSDEEDMLTYRGIRYRVAKSAPQEDHSHESEDLVEGIYRGQHWQRWRPDSEASHQHQGNQSEITYRGHKIIKPERES